MTAATKPRGVHLVGSVALSNTEEVFRTVSSILGNHLRRLPDGETGDRRNWIGWQIEVLRNTPGLEVVPPDPTEYAPMLRFKLQDRSAAKELSFGPLGYAAAAISSYAIFTRLRAAGEIPTGVRFQVSLPTPVATVYAFVIPADQEAVEPAYERRMLQELAEITAAIPHEDLAIQWDVAVEVGLLEGVFPTSLQNLESAIPERLVRLGNRVPEAVALGYHFCYGDYEHQHFKQPEDTSKLVQLINAVAAGVTRPIQWVHLPVPRNRMDDAYFAPLRNLRLHPETELYLGLVHYTDGVEGTRKRIEAAQRTISAFGVATECGMGRRPPETIPALLRIHAEVAAPVS